MTDPSVYILGTAAVTPLAATVRENCGALLEGRTCFTSPRHFDSRGRLLGVDFDLDGKGSSRMERLLGKLADSLDFAVPAGTRLFAATTVGAIDLLEQGNEADTVQEFLHLAERIFDIPNGILVSAACASGQTAAALAMRRVRICIQIRSSGGLCLEKEMAPHSSILAWESPWTEDPEEVQSRGSQRAEHD